MAEKKILLVIPPLGFHDAQYEACRRLWEKRGYKVSVASLEKGIARGEAGAAVPIDVAIEDVKTYDYDAAVFLGGEGVRRLFDDESVRKLAKDVKYKVVAASDNAVVLLALAGALEDKKVAGPPESVSWLLKGGAQYTAEPIWIDDKLITIQDPGITERMANEVIAALEK
jgi:protease I